jgi:hypothetical protein
MREYVGAKDSNFIVRWTRGKIQSLWNRFVRRLEMEFIMRGFVHLSHGEQRLKEHDERALYTAVIFALEAMERSKDNELVRHAFRHHEDVMLARLHQHHMDCIRELPQKSSEALPEIPTKLRLAPRKKRLKKEVQK